MLNEFALIDFIVTDFDGVHTPNTAFLGEDGREMVQINRSDGLGIDFWTELGFPFLVVSKEKKPLAALRAEKLGVDCLPGVDDKVSALQDFIVRGGHEKRRSLYVGNDINDLPVMSNVDLPVAVRDSYPEVLSVARYTTRALGGHGAVREVVDIIIAAKRGCCYLCMTI